MNDTILHIESGTMGNPAYEIECLPHVARCPTTCGITVQMDASAVRDLIWWHRPTIAGIPLQEVPGFEDDDTLLDAAIEAVHAWVATFPPVAEQVRREQGRRDVIETNAIITEIEHLNWAPHISTEADRFTGRFQVWAAIKGYVPSAIQPSPFDFTSIARAGGETRVEAARELLVEVNRKIAIAAEMEASR